MRKLFWVMLVVAVAVPASLWIYSVGNPLEYLETGVPDGQFLYILSKLAGLIGISLIGLQLVMLRFRQHANGGHFKWSMSSHKLLGLSLAVVVVLHVGLFVAAASLRSGHLALGPLSLRFFQGFYDQMISLGALAFYLLALASVVGVLIYKVPRFHRYRIIHIIAVFVMTLLAGVHSAAVGSETRSIPMMTFYALLAVILIWSVWSVRSRWSRVKKIKRH